ncbi:phosphoenolpyruvate carboxykinase [Wigglesworthia glossinidia endosymbiont of Glossina morsitans morsitans (Yale colony)]|uniref:Phosphoenolpyruvate carboxykinase (ATP) n=1 Tax=Wigglesworthia glossinidia endosymbiont of Glossina morsitans morsitans (Yale colony) TaxID=1142511 RepID=H6Q4F9_WIGGL|nr:phosphoenolpyruvate carboxykinase (ATP) [Wigglesworthia glossinidia]AFA41019.1 phosphoenolpyruvate carboxykinase [Wigglesworthia glossinidia endosymbiont of Glossina morsitans morsitans (Yale colony)]
MQIDKIANNLKIHGINKYVEIIYNPTFEKLFEEETNHNLDGLESCTITKFGAISVDTGEFTGRSPKDKYFVRDSNTINKIWWSDHPKHQSHNYPISEDVWNSLYEIVINKLKNQRLFVIDAFCGATIPNRLKIRFITDIAWQAHFVKNMFIRPIFSEISNFCQDFTILSAPKAVNMNWKKQKLNSENFIAINLTKRILLIGGTWYGGEIKKGLFSVMNYILPLKQVASMHCASNVGIKNDVALFFGLSGTGKTTLSTDSKRFLIGDDEHGWDANGIFNFEGGCYAKTINLSKEKEPEIYGAIKKNALLENVVVFPDKTVNFEDSSKTENTRVSYPIYHIKNIVQPISSSGHASYIIFLTADAFGVLPCVSMLSKKQGLYHFLSGFTSKISGTERGIVDPEPTFSSCFGEAFLSLYPTVYAEVLFKYIKSAHSKIFLINTGWNGYGIRYSLKNTRKIIKNILDGSLNSCVTYNLPIFNLKIPQNIQGINPKDLDPRFSFKSHQEWDIKAKKLAKKFVSNFCKFEHTDLGKILVPFGPQY